VHAALHQQSGFSSVDPQHFGKFPSRRKQYRAASVKMQNLPQHEFLDKIPNPPSPEWEPPRCVFVYVGVPARHEWNTHTPARDRAQNAQFTRSHYVNDIRCELSQALLELVSQTVEGQVEPKVGIDTDRKRASFQFQRPKRTIGSKRLVLSKADTEER